MKNTTTILKNVGPRQARPNTGDADAREFCKYLAGKFQETFKTQPPIEVFISCSLLMYPESAKENPPDPAKVVRWIGR
jgi:hypothetical protein